MNTYARGKWVVSADSIEQGEAIMACLERGERTRARTATLRAAHRFGVGYTCRLCAKTAIEIHRDRLLCVERDGAQTRRTEERNG